jgi:hypothetical protein
VITLREDARNHRGGLDARHDLQPRSAPRTALDLDAGHPLQTLRPASAVLRPAPPGSHTGTAALVILDEIHRTPQLFRSLRGLIDAGRRRGQGKGRFLVLRSATIDLLRQSSESLAGRIRYLELASLDAGETGSEHLDALWLRGGFPDSLLADPDAASLRWRMDFIRAHLERDSPQLGPRIPAETLRRLWTMLAHHQGGLLNAAALVRALAVDGKTVASYLDLLVALLLAHPVAGGSWEGLAIESLIAAAPEGTQASFFRTAAGAEIDLLLKLPGQRAPWASEIKRLLAPKTNGFGRNVPAAQRRALRLAEYAALIRRAASNPIACRVKRPAAG